MKQSKKLKKISVDKYIKNKYLLSLLFDTYNCDISKEINNDNLAEFLELVSSMLSNYKEIPPIIFQNFIRTINGNLRLFKDKSAITDILITRYLVDKSKVGYSEEYLGSLKKELSIRRDSKKYLYYKNKDIISEMDAINKSLFNDGVVLYSHLQTTQEEFEEMWIPQFIDNPLYLESINSILSGCPELFLDKNFYSRVIYLLNLNYKLSDSKAFKKLQKNTMKSIHLSIKNKVN